MSKQLHLVLISLLLAGCGAIEALQATPTPDPAELVAAYMEEIEPILEEWDDALAIADQTPRMSLPGRISELQDIRRKAADIEPESPEIERAHALLISAMDSAIDAFLAFLGQEPDSVVSKEFEEYYANIERWSEVLAIIGE